MISRIPLLGLTGATLMAILLVGPAHAADDAKVAPLKLTPEEVAERAARKGCKIKICSTFLLKKPGDDVRCNVVKSWRKAQLDKMVKKARVSWPWGKVTCTTDISLPRDQMIQAMDSAKFELKLEKHTVSCVVEREKEPATIKFSFAPKVKFEGGKAKKAALNWGKIEAPTLIKGAMWTATATDNTFGVLQSTLVEDINEFIGKKCPAIKDELK
ncbi:MAG: hypothetical protein JXQ99_26535 [Hyphomicrobiaceae bacterium]